MPSQLDLDLDKLAVTSRSDDRKVDVDASDDESPGCGFPLDEAIADIFPPESFWLSKDAEYDWFDRNAFLDRKDSTKANSYLNSHVKASISNPNSQRFPISMKSKASIIGLPKSQKAAFADSCRRTCKSANIKLFPKRSTSVGPSAEPGSPKVTCIGRVRSKRCGRKPEKKSEKPQEKSSKGGREKTKPGAGKKRAKFYSKVMSIFRSKKGHKKPPRSGSLGQVEEETPASSHALRRSVSYRAVSEPPSLGGMKRFASGRRPESWTGEDFNQVVLEPLDLDGRVWIVGKR